MKFRDLVMQVEEDGWYFHQQKGSHAQYKHPSKTSRVTIAGKPGQEVPEGTRKSILKQAGLR